MGKDGGDEDEGGRAQARNMLGTSTKYEIPLSVWQKGDWVGQKVTRDDHGIRTWELCCVRYSTQVEDERLQ